MSSLVTNGQLTQTLTKENLHRCKIDSRKENAMMPFFLEKYQLPLLFLLLLLSQPLLHLLFDSEKAPSMVQRSPAI
jgi:hypothetical protein